jgi:putative transposase
LNWRRTFHWCFIYPSVRQRLIGSIDGNAGLCAFVAAKRVAWLRSQVKPPGTDHAELVICDYTIDITYVPLLRGFMYLVAILDWYSRYVLAWDLSNTLDGIFCLTALERALQQRQPEIFNSDQGVQFTSLAFTGRLQQTGVRISMDGRGRALDNVFVERLWRTVKYEHVYLHEYETVMQLEKGLAGYFTFYNHERPHQSLSYQTPARVYTQGAPGREVL